MIIDNTQSLLSVIMSDKIGFCLFEILFFLIFFYAFLKDIILSPRRKVMKIIRGKKSRRIFLTSASAFLTFVLLIIFIITSYPTQGRVLLYIINLGMVIYLFFFSSWFTNKLVGWWTRFEQREF